MSLYALQYSLFNNKQENNWYRFRKSKFACRLFICVVNICTWLVPFQRSDSSLDGIHNKEITLRECRGTIYRWVPFVAVMRCISSTCWCNISIGTTIKLHYWYIAPKSYEASTTHIDVDFDNSVVMREVIVQTLPYLAIFTVVALVIMQTNGA